MNIYKRNCNNCKQPYAGYGKYYCSSRCQPRIKHSLETRKKMSGANRWNWKGKKAGYYAFHQWLKTNYGKANKCENKDCLRKKTKRYEWALLKGKKHDHKRKNYWMLCKSCHSKYDGIDELARKLFFKKGKPLCKNCKKTLSTYNGLTGLCGLCNRKLNPPWLGKKRK